MLYLAATAAPLVFSFLLLKMRKRNIGTEFSCGGLFHFPITVSLRGKVHVDWWAFLFSNCCLATRKRKNGSHECIFAFVMPFIWRTQKANTTAGHKSHLCFPIITNWNTNKGLFDYLFVCFFQLNDTKRKNKRRHIQEMLLFCFHFFTLRIERNETMYNGSYFYFPFFVYELGRRKRKPNLPFPIFYYGFGKRKRKDDIYSTRCFSVFPFFILQKKKRKYV